MHWYMNNNTCCLTETEKLFRNVKTDELFFEKLVGPVYKPRHDPFIIITMISLWFINYNSSREHIDKTREKINILINKYGGW